MSIQNMIKISVVLRGDGTSTVFNFDLASDPYFVAPIFAPSGTLENWFEKKSPLPVDVLKYTASDPYSVSLSGTIVTVTFNVAPLPFPQAMKDVSLLVCFEGR